LPLDFTASKFVADAFGLNDFKRLEILSEGAVFFGNKSWKVLTDGRRRNGATDFRNIDGNDFAVFGVDNGAKIKRKGVLVIRRRRAIVHQSLLETDGVSPVQLTVIDDVRLTIVHRNRLSRGRNRLYSYP